MKKEHQKVNAVQHGRRTIVQNMGETFAKDTLRLGVSHYAMCPFKKLLHPYNPSMGERHFKIRSLIVSIRNVLFIRLKFRVGQNLKCGS